MNNNQSNNQNAWWETGNNQSAWWETGNSQWQHKQDGEQGPSVNVPPHFYVNEQQMQAKRKASTSLTLGIVGLVLSLLVTPLVGIILGIIAIVKSNTSKKLYPTPFPEARTGKILGILAIIFGALPIAIFLIIVSATFFLALLSIIF